MKEKKMEAALNECETATDVAVKPKHSKADIQKPSKPKFKIPGTFSWYLFFHAVQTACCTLLVVKLEENFEFQVKPVTDAIRS